MKNISYAIGMNIGANLLQSGAKNLDYAEVAAGLQAIIEGKEPRIAKNEAVALLNKFFTELEEKMAEAAKSEGEAFLAANATRKGVVSLPSGLQYEIMKEGNGPKPKATDTVLCHYHGTLVDGTVFDSSVRRGQPAAFPVNGVIAGWVEALQLMPVGSKWKLFIPYNLAYGARGAGESIPPYAALVFEVELLEIK